MISKATMYLGLNDKETKIQKYDTVEAYKIVTNEVASRFGGGTISAADGMCVYYNRTWERFRYESVLREAIDKFPKAMRESLRAQIIEKKGIESREKAEAFLGAFRGEYEKLSDANKRILSKSPQIESAEQAEGVLSVMKFMNAIDAICAK